jgi:hypothetical protein
MNMLGLSSSVHYAHIVCYWKLFLLHHTQVLCQYRLCRADHAYFTYLYLMLQGSLITWTSPSIRLLYWCSLYSFGADLIENTISNSFLVTSRVRGHGKVIIGPFLETAVSSGSTIPVFYVFFFFSVEPCTCSRRENNGRSDKWGETWITLNSRTARVRLPSAREEICEEKLWQLSSAISKWKEIRRKSELMSGLVSEDPRWNSWNLSNFPAASEKNICKP